MAHWRIAFASYEPPDALYRSQEQGFAIARQKRRQQKIGGPVNKNTVSQAKEYMVDPILLASGRVKLRIIMSSLTVPERLLHLSFPFSTGPGGKGHGEKG